MSGDNEVMASTNEEVAALLREYAELLGKADLRLTRVVPTASPVSVVEAGVA